MKDSEIKALDDKLDTHLNKLKMALVVALVIPFMFSFSSAVINFTSLTKCARCPPHYASFNITVPLFIVDVILASASYYFFKSGFEGFRGKVSDVKFGVVGAYLLLVVFLTQAALLLLPLMTIKIGIVAAYASVVLYFMLIVASALIAQAFTSLGRSLKEGSIGLGAWMWTVSLILPLHPLINLVLMVMGLVIVFRGLTRVKV